MPTHGTLTLYIDDEKVGSAQIKTQPGNFSLVGEGLNVGKDAGEPVTDDYAGSPVGVHRRHDQAGDRRRLRRAVRRPGEGSRGDDEAGVTRVKPSRRQRPANLSDQHSDLRNRAGYDVVGTGSTTRISRRKLAPNA